jgi:RimJ/RimL family protein N-acetyltransferase
MTVELEPYERAEDFLARAGAYLGREELRYNLLLGVAASVVGGHPPSVLVGPMTANKHAPRFAAFVRGGEVVGAALRTPPFKLLMTELDADATALLVEWAKGLWPDLKGSLGPSETSERFRAQWGAASSCDSELWMPNRLHRLTAVATDLPPCEGFLRPFVAEDRPALAAWLEGFNRDAHLQDPVDYERAAQRNIERQTAFGWEVGGRLVTMALCSARTHSTVRVGGVYTPPELRGQGWATACVAALSQRLLDEGVAECCLYTDLRNPTSNRIYARIGYQPVEDWLDFRYLYPEGHEEPRA